MKPSFNLKEYLNSQIEEINKIKWIESEKKGSDIGFNEAKDIWIDKYAENYRTYWLESHDLEKNKSFGDKKRD